jgi:hypothetical protein
MSLIDRVKNLSELSKYRVEDKNLVGDKLDTPKLVIADKPKGMAKIIQIDTIDNFPEEGPDDYDNPR